MTLKEEIRHNATQSIRQAMVANPNKPKVDMSNMSLVTPEEFKQDLRKRKQDDDPLALGENAARKARKGS